MSDVEGWWTVGEFENATVPDYEEADDVSGELGEDTRAVTLRPSDKIVLERRVDAGDRWVRIAEFTVDESHHAATSIGDELSNSDDYRIVDVIYGKTALEKRVTE